MAIDNFERMQQKHELMEYMGDIASKSQTDLDVFKWMSVIYSNVTLAELCRYLGSHGVELRPDRYPQKQI